MTDKNLKRISKFLSFILRHEPQSIGLTLDDQGWAVVDELLRQAKLHDHPITLDQLMTVIKTNDKQRFTLSADQQRIRAAQGHTLTSVQIDYTPTPPPPKLYHGTASRFMKSIQQQGLKPKQRHHVHLTESVDTARSVGSRYGLPVILQVDTAAMLEAGFTFYLSDNQVWLAQEVPARFLTRYTLD